MIQGGKRSKAHLAGLPRSIPAFSYTAHYNPNCCEHHTGARRREQSKPRGKTQASNPAETWNTISVLLKKASSEQKCTGGFRRRQIKGRPQEREIYVR